MRRLLGAVALLVVLAAVHTSAAEPVVVTHMAYSKSGNVDIYVDWLSQRAAAFEKMNPGIKIELMQGPQNKLEVMVLGGVAPDVMQLPDFDHWGPLGFYVNLRPLLERDRISRLIHPQVYAKLLTDNGRIYKAPQDTVSTPLYFNRDLFNEAGLQHPDKMGKEWTWDAFLVAGKKLTVDRDGDGNPETYGVDRPWGGWRLAVNQAGGAFYGFDAKGQPVKSLWNSPEVLAGVEYVQKMYLDQSTPHLRPGIDQKDYRFETGKTALDAVDNAATVARLQGARFDWDFAFQPAGPAGPLGSAGIQGMYVFASTKNLPQVWEWVKFICFDTESMESYAAQMGRIPVVLSAQRVWPKAAGVTDKNYDIVLQQTLYQAPDSYPVAPELSARNINLNKVWLNQVPARQHLQSIHEQMTAILSQALNAK